MQTYLPKITLPTVVIAGVVDGINPCAFTALLATNKAGEQNINTTRARLVGMGSIYKEWVRLVLGSGALPWAWQS